MYQLLHTGFCILNCKDNVDNEICIYSFCRSKAIIEDMVIYKHTWSSYPAVSDNNEGQH